MTKPDVIQDVSVQQTQDDLLLYSAFLGIEARFVCDLLHLRTRDGLFTPTCCEVNALYHYSTREVRDHAVYQRAHTVLRALGLRAKK